METKKEKNERLVTNIIIKGIEVGLGVVTGHGYLSSWIGNDGINELDKRKDIVFDSNGKPKLKSTQPNHSNVIGEKK